MSEKHSTIWLALTLVGLAFNLMLDPVDRADETLDEGIASYAPKGYKSLTPSVRGCKSAFGPGVAQPGYLQLSGVHQLSALVLTTGMSAPSLALPYPLELQLGLRRTDW